MRISQDKLSALYNAICDPVFNLRVKCQFKGHEDYLVAQLGDTQWDNVCQVLNIQDYDDG